MRGKSYISFPADRSGLSGQFVSSHLTHLAGPGLAAAYDIISGGLLQRVSPCVHGTLGRNSLCMCANGLLGLVARGHAYVISDVLPPRSRRSVRFVILGLFPDRLLNSVQ